MVEHFLANVNQLLLPVLQLHGGNYFQVELVVTLNLSFIKIFKNKNYKILFVMKQVFIATVLIFFISTLSAQDSTKDVTAINTQVDAFFTSWNKHDFWRHEKLHN